MCGRRRTSKELASTAVFHAEIEIVLRLERVVEGDDKRMVASSQDFLFGQRTLDLVALDHLLFTQDYPLVSSECHRCVQNH